MVRKTIEPVSLYGFEECPVSRRFDVHNCEIRWRPSPSGIRESNGKAREISNEGSFHSRACAFRGFFLYNGINHFRQRKNLAQYAGAKKVPMAEVSVIASGIALTFGGASILLGVKPKLGSLAILGFLVSASPLMHDFWRAEDPNQRTSDMIQFMKNLALAGGALALMGVEEPWPASVAASRSGAIDGVEKPQRTPFAA